MKCQVYKESKEQEEKVLEFRVSDIDERIRFQVREKNTILWWSFGSIDSNGYLELTSTTPKTLGLKLTENGHIKVRRM